MPADQNLKGVKAYNSPAGGWGALKATAKAVREQMDMTEAPLLLYVGRLSPEKNIEELKHLLTAIPGARLALIGGGPHRSLLEQHFKDTGTFFAGYLHGEELASAFASADIFALPSRTETLGLVLLEAMGGGFTWGAALVRL